MKERYVDFLLAVYKRFNCDTVVCAGDEIDHHMISFHDPEPEAMGAADEYIKALEQLSTLYKAFPKVKVCLSNHTMRHIRKGKQAGIPSFYFRSLKSLLKAPKGWNWAEDWTIDGVLYRHAENYSGKVPHKDIIKDTMQSTVIGHPHTIGGVEYVAAKKGRLFGMSVGCGVDQKAYAFHYAKSHKVKSIIGCGVILEGKEAFFIPMNLPKKRRKK